MLRMPIERASSNAWVACAASVLLSRTASARPSKPWTPRLRRFTPLSSHAASFVSSVLAGFASRVISASRATSKFARMKARSRVASSAGSRLGVPPGSFPSVVQGLSEEGRVAERDGLLALPGHRVELHADSAAAAPLLELLSRQPLAPPSLSEATRQAGASAEVVRALAQRGDIVRVGDDVAFTKDAYETAVAMVREIISDSGSITVAQLRDRMGASRRPVLALLEHLDSQRVTRRVGDARVLR